MADRFDKFTERARRALQTAQEQAVRLGNDQITAEHLLLGVIHDPSGVACHALARLDVKVDELARDLTTPLSAQTAKAQSLGGLSDSARKSIELAVDEARRLDHHYVGTEHLLLGLLRVETSPAAEALKAKGVTLQVARTAIAAVLAAGPSVSAGAALHEEHERLMLQVTAFLANPANRPAESEAGLFQRLSDEALQVFQHAYEEAEGLSHNYVGTEHILLGLVHDPRSVAGKLLADLGVDVAKVRNAVEFIIGRGDRQVAGDIGLTPRTKKVIELSFDEARRLHHEYVGAEHLLLGLIREGEGIASGVLESFGVSTERIRAQMLEFLGLAHLPPTPARVSRGGQGALTQAQLVARWYYHAQVDTEHLLVGLVREQGLAANVLQLLGVQWPGVLGHFEALAPAGSGQATSAEVGYTLAAQAAIERATWEADQRGHPHAGSGHLLLGVLAIEGGHARDLLERVGTSPEAVRQAVEARLANEANA